MEPQFRTGMLRMLVIGFAAVEAIIVSGASVLVHAGGGLYWLVPGVLLSFTAAMVDAWGAADRNRALGD